VYAAIMLIGVIGLTCDLALGAIGRVLFPWKREVKPSSLFARLRGKRKSIAPPAMAEGAGA
jgi:hypothetical protein